MTLPTRALGKNGPQVAAMGFGLMVQSPQPNTLGAWEAACADPNLQGLSAFFGAKRPDEERFGVLDRALELGETFWDTSDLYGDSEDLIGNWFKRTGNRDKIFLATKFGVQMVWYTLAYLLVSDLR